MSDLTKQVEEIREHLLSGTVGGNHVPCGSYACGSCKQLTLLAHIDELRAALDDACNNWGVRVRGDIWARFPVNSGRAELETIAEYRRLIGGEG